MPGPVVRGHAKLESVCGNCHVRFDRAAQPRLCLGCHDHRAVAQDVRAGTGFHGRLKQRECRACHTEHRGRNARIIVLDEQAFDHARTDFTLRGKHRDVECAKCHRPGTRHRNAPSQCIGCHRKDDRHKGGLGERCAECHNETTWKDARFDHAKTKFPLRDRHAKVKCPECHAKERYKGISQECISCHRKDDEHRGHFGARCQTCHNAAEWKHSTFAHEEDTHFPLRGRHRKVKCQTCHKGPIYRDKLPTTCYACHRADDTHKGMLGAKCENCHTESGWKASRFNHDDDTRFPLRDKHRDVKCEDCHRDKRFRDRTPSTCSGCHERDDQTRGHQGRFGTKCETCHTERGWKTVKFNHDRDTTYPLRGKHRQARCNECHTSPAAGQQKLDLHCFACHERDDKHKRQLGDDCERCHVEQGWREKPFDHEKSRFPLRGKHVVLECKKCHLSPAFRDVGTACIACHARDDRHRQRLGLRCDQCHDAQTWKKAHFSHDKDTRFRLEGAHARTVCLACHTEPVEGRLTLAMGCVDCHRKDDVHLHSYGPWCKDCHVPQKWRQTIRPAPKRRDEIRR